jgi:hypothetical protein
MATAGRGGTTDARSGVIPRKETIMGYNRAGARAKQKVRRRRKEERRLAAKAVPKESPELVGTVRRAAKKVAEVVGEGVEKVKEKVTGKGMGTKESG